MSTTETACDDHEIVTVFEAADEPVLSAPEIAEAVGMTRQGVTYRLNQLEAEGIVARKRLGSRAVAWWLAEG